MLDMHQDVWSEFTCGDGAPAWAVRDDDEPISCPGQWFMGYFEPGVKACFDNFWDAGGPHADLQERYVAMWVAVAERFRDHPAVIAYDIINEPHPGSDFDVAEAVGLPSDGALSTAFDREKLQPFYQRVIDAVRAVDEDTWIAFEPRYGAPGNGAAVFFIPLDDPRPGLPRLLYAPHLYSVALEGGQSYDPANDSTVADWERHRAAEVERLGTALVCGEWGLAPSWENARLFMREALDAQDRLMAGWAYWDWGPSGWSWLNADLTERETTDDIVRVYPQRIAGVPVSFGYDPDARTFRLEFVDHPAVQGPTEIYIPARRFYPDGWDLQLNDTAGSWSTTWDAEREILSLTVPPTGRSHVVELSPASR